MTTGPQPGNSPGLSAPVLMASLCAALGGFWLALTHVVLPSLLGASWTEPLHTTGDGLFLRCLVGPVYWQSRRQVIVAANKEQELDWQVQILRSISDSISYAIYAKDSSGRYLFINPAGARLLGRPVAEIIGKTDTELLPAQRAALVRSA